MQVRDCILFFGDKTVYVYFSIIMRLDNLNETPIISHIPLLAVKLRAIFQANLGHNVVYAKQRLTIPDLATVKRLDLRT